MNITLALNYIQRINRRLAILYYISIQIGVFAIRRFNNAKDGEAFRIMPDCNACMLVIHLLLIYLERGAGDLRHTANGVYP